MQTSFQVENLIEPTLASPSYLALRAMNFAKLAHANHRRKYTNTPYADHLAEVAGIVATVAHLHPNPEVSVAVAWLHDCVEDQEVTEETLALNFGEEVAKGVMLLSDLETGNRATRKSLACARLANAPAWVQDIKVADLISNTGSITEHDPKFATTYLDEKRALLNVLSKANRYLLTMAERLV